MGGARGRFEKSGVDVGKILDFEDAASCQRSAHVQRSLWRIERHTRISTVLRKAAVHGHAMGLEILAKQLLASTAIEALAAELGVVCADSVADFEAFDLGAYGCYHANGLVTLSIILLEVAMRGRAWNGTGNKGELEASPKSVIRLGSFQRGWQMRGVFCPL